MKTLMYPIAPEDDFPETFCAIRPYSGECQFYTPEGESASWMLFRAETENAKLQASNEVIAEDHAALCEQNAKLRERIERLQPTDSDGNVLDIADTVHMLRSEYDGDHEWDDVIVELTLTKWGGDRWIVRGSKGEAWACDCTKTGYDEDAFEDSDNVEPFDDATLAEVENTKLRELLADTCMQPRDYCQKYGIEYESWDSANAHLDARMRELGVEVTP